MSVVDNRNSAFIVITVNVRGALSPTSTNEVYHLDALAIVLV